MRKITLYLLAAVAAHLLCCDCTSKKNTTLDNEQNIVTHASLLQMQPVGVGYTLCQIMNPWRDDEAMAQYLLVPKSDKQWNDEKLAALGISGGCQIIRTPLERMTVTTACHTWLLQQLDATKQIGALCDTAYIASKEVKAWLRQHPEIADAGQSTTPNTEVIMMEKSEAVWISPFENADLSSLQHLPTTLIYCADYMENSPVARAEWMRFYGRLVDKASEADALFKGVASRYDSLTIVAQEKYGETKPLLLAEIPYGATWYVPGGCSTSAHLYQDAGYCYPWSDDTHAGSLSLSLEAVLAKAGECDKWLIKYMDDAGDWSLQQFVEQNPYYGQFKAARNGEVWGCNTAQSDFFDVTPFRPDMLLESLVNEDGCFFKRLATNEE